MRFRFNGLCLLLLAQLTMTSCNESDEHTLSSNVDDGRGGEGSSEPARLTPEQEKDLVAKSERGAKAKSRLDAAVSGLRDAGITLSVQTRVEPTLQLGFSNPYGEPTRTRIETTLRFLPMADIARLEIKPETQTIALREYVAAADQYLSLFPEVSYSELNRQDNDCMLKQKRELAKQSIVSATIGEQFIRYVTALGNLESHGIVFLSRAKYIERLEAEKGVKFSAQTVSFFNSSYVLFADPAQGSNRDEMIEALDKFNLSQVTFLGDFDFLKTSSVQTKSLLDNDKVRELLKELRPQTLLNSEIPGVAQTQTFSDTQMGSEMIDFVKTSQDAIAAFRARLVENKQNLNMSAPLAYAIVEAMVIAEMELAQLGIRFVMLEKIWVLDTTFYNRKDFPFGPKKEDVVKKFKQFVQPVTESVANLSDGFVPGQNLIFEAYQGKLKALQLFGL